MATATITNGESGSSVRAKLNGLLELSLNSGEALTAGEVGYVKSDGKVWEADASAEATAGGVVVGIITTTVGAADTATTLQIGGNFATTGLTAGSVYYISETKGAVPTTTAPTTTAAIVRVVGYATSTTNFVVDPDPTWVEVGAATTTINAQTGTTYELVLTDAGKLVTMNNGSASTLNIPDNATVAFPVGTVLDVLQIGAGLVTVTDDAGVTLNGETTGAGAIATQGQYKAVSLVKHATDGWYVIGGA